MAVAVGHEVGRDGYLTQTQRDLQVWGEDQLEQHVVCGVVQLVQHVVWGEEQLEQHVAWGEVQLD